MPCLHPSLLTGNDAASNPCRFKLTISVGADLLGKIVGGGAAGLVMSLKSGAKAASHAADAAGDASRASRGLDACPAGAMSFSGDTAVLMADGTRKRIDQIRQGDQVAAADPQTGETGARAVEATWPHRDDLITLRTSAGQILTTEDHPYWNATDNAWQQIQQFNRGDQLLTPNGNRVTVLALDWSTRTHAPAYNLTVNDLHTYNVLTTNDTPVLVHNCGTYDRPSGYRAGVRDQVWANAVEESTGRVRDPLTGRFMSADAPWDMGHLPGHEFRRHAADAEARGVTRVQFLNEHTTRRNTVPSYQRRTARIEGRT